MINFLAAVSKRHTIKHGMHVFLENEYRKIASVCLPNTKDMRELFKKKVIIIDLDII